MKKPKKLNLKRNLLSSNFGDLKKFCSKPTDLFNYFMQTIIDSLVHLMCKFYPKIL